MGRVGVGGVSCWAEMMGQILSCKLRLSFILFLLFLFLREYKELVIWPTYDFKNNWVLGYGKIIVNKFKFFSGKFSAILRILVFFSS
jgi:hypothetical protein